MSTPQDPTRIIWLLESESGTWWPAVQYSNFGQVLRCHQKDLSWDVKGRIAGMIVEKGNQALVARWVGDKISEKTVFQIDEDTEKEDFYAHFGAAWSQYEQNPGDYEEGFEETVAEALRLAAGYDESSKNAPAPAVKNTESKKKSAAKPVPEKKKKKVVKSSSKAAAVVPSIDEASSSGYSSVSASTRSVGLPPYTGIPIRSSDDFDKVWDKLGKNGWKTRHDDERLWYCMPQIDTLKDGDPNQTIFTKKQMVSFLGEHYNWYPDESDADDDGSDEENVRPVFAAEKKTLTKKKRKKQESVAGKSKKKLKPTDGLSTPDHRTKPQDPSKPLSPEEDDSVCSGMSEENKYRWQVLWPELKTRGWTHAKSRNPLKNWYFIRPGRSHNDGQLGVDYFDSPSKVIEFERQQDGVVALKPKSPPLSTQKGRRTKAGRMQAKRAEEEQQQKKKSKSTSAPVAKKDKKKRSAPVPVEKEQEPTKKLKTSNLPKQWWQEKEPVPSYLGNIWPTLQKIGFYYSNGEYRLPKQTGNDNGFSYDRDLCSYLAEHGIPNIDLCDKTQAEMLDRWVRLAHVPMKVLNLEDFEAWDDTDAWRVLSGSLGFKKTSDGSIVRENEKFKSLGALRVHLRGSESLDPPPAEGRRARRGEAPSQNLEEGELVGLRLWAALAPEPIHTIPSTTRYRTPLQSSSSTGKDKKNDPRRITMSPSNLDGRSPLN